MTDLNAVNIRPGVSILSVLPHLNYKPWHALAEFVDNAIQNFLSQKREIEEKEGTEVTLEIDIVFDSNTNTIKVTDNAAGIDSKAYPRAFRPAELPPDATGLSEFGMGMKSAACWFAPKWTVRTAAIGEKVERTVIFDISEIVKDSLEELNIVSQSAPEASHYTEITLQDVRQFPRGRTLGKIRDHLQGIYRRFIERQGIVLRINGVELEYESPKILSAARWNDSDLREIEWRKSIDFELADGRSVTGWAGIRETGSTTHAGFALFRRNRLIVGSGDEPYRPRYIFGASNSFESQRIVGELDLRHFQISHTKDGISWDGCEDEFIEKLKTQLDSEPMPLLKQAKKYRSQREAERKRSSIKTILRDTASVVENRHEFNLDSQSEGDGSTDISESAGAYGDAVDRSRVLSIRSGSSEWDVQVTVTYSQAIDGWYEIYRFADDPAENPRKMDVKVNFGHPFLNRFAVGDEAIEGFIRLAVALAVAEARARDGGVRNAGMIRKNLNAVISQILSSAV